jgi:cellulose synthase/poly-beta-1,6-N-acetylglucosamine synthase-like glycosyltransferase
MLLFHSIVGGALGLLWLLRLIETAVGMPKMADISKPQWDIPISGAGNAPRVTIVLPARNEEECIERCLSSLLALDYPSYEIIAVDDRSTDSTGAIMDRLAEGHSASKLKVIHVNELPAGWLGKTHAMWKAAAQGTGEWILFTDGDIIFRSDCLRRAVAYLDNSQADHLVLGPTIIMESFGERMMISFLQIMFAFIRPWKVSDPKSRVSIGAGAFNLIRRSAYEKLGTYEKLRLAVIDDLQLGVAVKKNGFSQHMVFGIGLISVRWAKSAFGVVENLTKNVFALMRFRWYLAVGAALGLAIVNAGPFVGFLVAPGWSRLGYAVAVVSIAMLYWGMSWLSKVSPLYFLVHPISASLFAFTILRSTWLTLGQGGVIWRGTKYSLDELRESIK